MRFDGLTLAHFKCYEEASVSFDRGVTVIHGPNGAGKSTLLDACFFALYGSETLRDSTLDEVITSGAAGSQIGLDFAHNGIQYSIDRELTLRGDRATTARCTLETPERTVDGARAVRSAVTEMLRMDVDAFLNCAYVRQGEVNKLIHASPQTRQDMIDELLQLGQLETYRDRATRARRAISSLRDELAGEVAGIESQITNKEEKDLPAALSEQETRLARIEDELESLRERLEEIDASIEEATTILERYAERREEREAIEDEIDALRTSIEEATETRGTITEEIAAKSDERASLQEDIRTQHTAYDITPVDRSAVTEALTAERKADEEFQETLENARLAIQEHKQRAEEAARRADERRERAAEYEEQATSLEEEHRATKARLEERKAQIDDLRTQRDEHLESVRDSGIAQSDIDEGLDRAEEELAAVREDEQECRSDIRALEREIAAAEELKAAGKCPTCGQPVSEAPSVETIETKRDQLEAKNEALAAILEKRDQLEATIEEYQQAQEHLEKAASLSDRIDTAHQLLQDTEETLADIADRAENARQAATEDREAATEAESVATQARDRVSEARENVATVNERRAEIKENIAELEQLVADHETLESLTSEIKHLQTKRNGIDELLSERKDRLREKEQRRMELSEDINEERVADARKTREAANEKREHLIDKRDMLAEERDEVLDHLGRIRNELEELEGLRDRHDRLTDRLTAIETAHEDAHMLEQLYGDLRSDLREQNVDTLESLFNETFRLVYQNDAYDRIELDREYRMSVHQKDGEILAPEQLSGGERAIFNLSLRCAIYRLLAEGIDGAAPLPPLILDEPTVYLDEGHVGQLVELIDAMRSLGVEQIIVVSHDRELLRAADTTLRVEKNPTTNRSTVESTVAGAIPTHD